MNEILKSKYLKVKEKTVLSIKKLYIPGATYKGAWKERGKEKKLSQNLQENECKVTRKDKEFKKKLVAANDVENIRISD
jgi:hypothetical protein